MSVEFNTPAERVIESFKPKNEFRLNTSLPDFAFLRALSVQGRLRYFQDTISTAAITITPSTGETFFFYKLIALNVNVNDPSTLSIVNDTQTKL